jgi:hypothetical protein
MKSDSSKIQGAFFVVVLILALAQLHGATGRWAGQWGMAQNVVEQVAGSGEEGEDSTLVEGGVPEMDFSPYFAAPPRDFLINPQDLLSPGAGAERMEFLRNHADDSKLELYVYVFGEGVEIPAETGVERFFSEKNAVVVFYFLGEPQRAGFYLSAPLVNVVSEAEQRRSLQSSVMQAAGKSDPEEQFEAFLVQMSIRLYWMERMMDEGVSDTDPLAKIEQNPAPKPQIRWSEISVPSHGLPWLFAGVCALFFLPVAWWVGRARARYRFPEFEVEPRLGGEHGAGVGAVITYLSPNVPPAAQRDQTPEYPRRM